MQNLIKALRYTVESRVPGAFEAYLAILDKSWLILHSARRKPHLGCSLVTINPIGKRDKRLRKQLLVVKTGWEELTLYGRSTPP